jgi:hypothetical protein
MAIAFFNSKDQYDLHGTCNDGNYTVRSGETLTYLQEFTQDVTVIQSLSVVGGLCIKNNQHVTAIQNCL